MGMRMRALLLRVLHSRALLLRGVLAHERELYGSTDERALATTLRLARLLPRTGDADPLKQLACLLPHPEGDTLLRAALPACSRALGKAHKDTRPLACAASSAPRRCPKLRSDGAP